jgi:hypothetical protein
MIKIFSGTLIEAAGILLIIFRMTVLRMLAGGTRVRIGQIIGDDRVPNSLLALILIGAALILAGNWLVFSGIRRLRRHAG